MAVALNPQILTWARDTAGLSVDEAANALGFKDAQDRTATDRLRALETGVEAPSRSVLLRMSQAYHRSLLVFYLTEPPRTGDRGHDFRRASGANAPEYDPTLDALIRDIRGRQGIVKDLLEQAEFKRVDYVSSVTMDVRPGELARRITENLSFELAEFRRQPTVQQAFSYLRDKVEQSGAFVLLIGNLGSYHTNIPSRVFRGYAIADPVAPFIIINDQDALVAWAFTALHELTHLWLGATGVSGGLPNTQIESYCNSIAGEILLPSPEIAHLEFLRRASLDETIASISAFARQRKISRGMVAYKLLRADIINNARWQELDRHYEDEWLASESQEVAKEKSEGGPSYYVLKRHRIGHALLNLVRNSLAEGMLTHTKAGQLLGVKPRNVDPVIYPSGTRGVR
jgi:Zn-dependent peptidase ImmA (M78 family)